ncbi:MAG: ArsR family transcriptional regulator [bacterium]
MKTPDLRPTLWRTMRVLAHPRRLHLLAALFRDAPLSVSDCATCCDMPRVSTSVALRQLQARGLIRAERMSRWVRYRPIPDPLVTHARAIHDAMRDALRPRKTDLPTICWNLTAYTHERRIRIVQALAVGPRTMGELSAACHISAPALIRHVDKLIRRKVVQRAGDHVSLLPPATPLAAALRGAMQADAVQS